MKKIIGLLLLTSCTLAMSDDIGTYYPVTTSTQLTITGVYKSSFSANSGFSWDDTRSDYYGNSYTQNPTVQSIEASQNLVLIKRIARIGLIFDISSLPVGVTVDSVFLQLYNTGAFTTVGTAIYTGRYLVCGSSSTADYSASCGGGVYKPLFDLLSYQTNSSAGYNTFRVDALPKSDIYGDDYVGYGVGEYEHDYIDLRPAVGESFEVEYDIGFSSLPKLIIYYTASSPSINNPRITIIN